MPDFTPLDDLLLEWEAAWRAGRGDGVDAYCPDWPEGRAELRRRANLLRKFDLAFAPREEDEAPALPGLKSLGELGRGGMGVVYRAWQQDLGREVAVKVMKDGPNPSPSAARRFAQEARLLARLRHDHIVPVHEAKLHDGQPYFVMELVRGGSLAGAMARYADDPVAAVRLVEQVAEAVHHAHEQGVLHRDLKPANILLDEQGRPWVSDFGLAKLLAVEWEESTVDEHRPGPAAPVVGPLTGSGAVMGTPPYMAPEQFGHGGGRVTARTDVWALGVILYELLSGRRPFEGDGPKGYARSVCEDTPLPLSTVRPDRALEAVVRRCLEKDPAARYPGAAALADDLARWRRGEAPAARPATWLGRLGGWVRRRPAAVAVGVLVAAVATAWATVSYLSDPERVRETVRRDLAAGRPVTLLRDTGPPVALTWAHGAATAKAAAAPGEPFFVSTHETALVELWPQAPAAYRLRAEIRHEHNADFGQVGIYFGFRPPEGLLPWPSGFVVAFSDRGRSAWQFPGPNGRTGSRVQTSFQYFPEGPGRQLGPGVHQLSGGVWYEPPAPGSATPWRTLEVQVTPAGITVFWPNERGEPEEVAQVRADWLDQMLSLNAAFFTPELTGYSFHQAYQGGLGLYVCDSSASFRRVVLEPVLPK